MLQFTEKVKYLGTATRSSKPGAEKQWSFTEALLSIPDLGRVKVMVRGDNVILPEVDQTINLMLSVNQGEYQKLSVEWDENSKFKLVA